MAKLWIVTLSLLLILNIVNASWYDANYNYRKPFNVSVASGTTETNYQIELNVTWDSDMATDFKDVIFIDSTDSIRLNHWLKEFKSSSWGYFYIKYPSNISTTNSSGYMYYGYPSASSKSNINTTFEFADHFTGSAINYTLWNQSYTGSSHGSVSIADSLLDLEIDGTANAYAYAQSSYSFGLNRKYVTLALSTGSDTNSHTHCFDCLESYVTPNPNTNEYPSTLIWFRSYSGVASEYLTSYLGGLEQTSLLNKVYSDQWNEFKIIRNSSDNTKFYINGTMQGTHTSQIPLIELPFYLKIGNQASAGISSEMFYDWVFVAKYHNPEPIIILGNEEIGVTTTTTTSTTTTSSTTTSTIETSTTTAPTTTTTVIPLPIATVQPNVIFQKGDFILGYCVDDWTLAKNTTDYYQMNESWLSTYSIQTKHCEYGCEPSLGICNPSDLVKVIFIIGLIIIFLGLIYLSYVILSRLIK